MKLRTKVILFFTCCALLLTAALGGYLYRRLWNDRIVTIADDIAQQLQYVDFILDQFLAERKDDLRHLAADPIVRSRNDRAFTSFLGAREGTFRYAIGPLEQRIIESFSSYEKTHPYVNVVYMGRENGSFVRSRKRERPTAYDPRERPWYLQAKAHPERVVVTEVYPSLTTPDINIGIVKALVDEKGLFFGVVGIDVTLTKLTRFIANLKISPAGRILLTDDKGVILVSEDRTLHYKNLRDYEPGLLELLTKQGQGYATLEIGGQKTDVHFRTAAVENWRIAALIPRETIEVQVRGPVALTVLGLSAGLFLVAVLTLFGLQWLVVGPLNRLAAESRYIAGTSDLDRRIDVRGRDEIGMLAASFNEMIAALAETQSALAVAGDELRNHRDHLEDLVRERTRRLEEVNETLAREVEARRRREEELERTLVELAEAKRRAEAADRLKSAFLATMSHELRTPLNSIIGFTGIILRERVGPLNEEQRKQLSMVRGSAQHLLALINDVLDISKIEAGQLTLAQEEVELHGIIEKAVLSTRPLADAKGVELAYEISPEIGTIPGDSRRVEQILLNLLSNAIKFTEKGSIRIVCGSDRENVIVRVIDTGIGIKPQDLAAVFETFRQIDSGISRKYEGTGLGLSISRRLVQMMGGQIGVTSTWGSGSTFSFVLPKQRSDR